MKSRLHSLLGFTLIELMIVVAIIAILAAIAYPSYQDSVRKSRRSDAMAIMQDLQLKQEKWRANNPQFGALAQITADSTFYTQFGDNKASKYYTFDISGTNATSYQITATAKGDQLNDKDGTTNCSPLTINQNNTKGPSACWKK